MLNLNIEKIKQKLDLKGVQYNRKTSIEVLKEFENKYNIVLPEELVSFYCEVCNGCSMIDGFQLRPIEEWKFDLDGISKMFPFEQCWIWEDDYDEEKIKQIVYGNIELLDIGDAQSWNIIISGPQKGQMWLFSDVGIQPCAPPKSFLEWFEFWLDGKENYFEKFEYSGFWAVLELNPTRDISVIKRAYAGKVKTYHPEEDPEGFLNLRRAYEAALDYAEKGSSMAQAPKPQSKPPVKRENLRENNRGGISTDSKEDYQGDCKEERQPVTHTAPKDKEGSLSGQSEPENESRNSSGQSEPEDEDWNSSSQSEYEDEDWSRSGQQEPEDEGWNISDQPEPLDEGPNPYEDHEAIRIFLDLYTGKQRKNSKLWLDYFTSDAFLDVAWDRRFTALLLEHVTRLEAGYPVNREFLNWLCVAYQFNVLRSVYRNPDGSERVEFRFQIDRGAQFDGQESIFEIATKGPAPKSPKGNELAVWYSFQEYRYLCAVAEDSFWSEREIGQFSQIIGCYAMIYITDKCQQRGDMDYERHPAGVRLMTRFLRREGLPEELYRIAWEKLDLKNAIMGRAKILYGSMRELVLECMPELDGKEKESFARLRTDFTAYAVSTHKRNGENAQATSEDIQSTDAFFAREDFKRALLDRRFVEEEMLHTWVDKARCDYYLNKVIQFYEEHETAPCARKVIDRAKEMLKYQALADRLLKDREMEVPKGEATMRSAPFFRHWINTSFYYAQDRASGQALAAYLMQELPYLPEWSREFLEYEEGKSIRYVAVTCTVGEDELEVRFYLHYMEFFLNGEQVYRPCLPWERVAVLEDTDMFFFLLPITMEVYDQYERVKAEILHRLEDTAVPEDGRKLIAGCLADHVCRLPLPNTVKQAHYFDEDEEFIEVAEPITQDSDGDEESIEVAEPLMQNSDEDEELIRAAKPQQPESALPFEVFAENGDNLYVCVWFQQEQILALFQQTPYGRQAVKGERYDDLKDAASAVTLARQLLQEQLFPKGFPMDELKSMPDAVYTQWDYTVVCHDEDLRTHWSIPRELLGEAVTAEIVETLLTQFQENRIQRLELSWKAAIPIGEEQGYESRRSLVFLKDHGKYACLYFDDFKAESYALLEKPELYGKSVDRHELVPFLQGRMFNHVIHHNFSTIRKSLDVIFRQVSQPNKVKFMAGGIWDYAVNVNHGRAKYNLDKQLLAGFPLEWAHNRPDVSFYFSYSPDAAVIVNEQGGVEILELGDENRFLLQRELARFFKQDLPRLRMTWGKELGRRRHIVLLQENGRFLMAWIQEKEKKVRFHVADRRTYMDVEGKKYPKDTFQGRVTPAYLLHDLIHLRNALDLLLANLENPGVVTDKIAEYAEEKPVKARPYEVLWTELVGDT